jgi:hypothetical protein
MADPADRTLGTVATVPLRIGLSAITIRFPDPEFAEAFQAYVNYFEDLAGSIGGLYGMTSSLAEGVHTSVASGRAMARIQRRQLDDDTWAAWQKVMRKAWGTLRRIHLEVADPDYFDEEANAWLPTQAYYAVYHCVIAFALASGQTIPKDHAAALKLVGQEVRRSRLPYPWNVACTGCPQLGTHEFHGFAGPVDSVHVLSRPDPMTAEDRIAMFLRTTRTKELERRFADLRQKRVGANRTRRNLSRAEKEQLASSMAPTTVFDVLWRLRKKANYDDADVFVLGASSERHARRLGESLVIVTDATIAALEALMAAYIGPQKMFVATTKYADRSSAAPGSAVANRVDSWRRQVVAMTAQRAVRS